MSRAFRPGDDPLAVRCMTPEERADLLDRVRASESTAAHRGAMLAAAHRWGANMGKLSPGDVTAIRAERARGTKLVALAALYGVSPATISRAVRRAG